MALTQQQQRVAKMWIRDRANNGDVDAILAAIVATPQQQIATLKAWAIEQHAEVVLRRDALQEGMDEASNDATALTEVKDA